MRALRLHGAKDLRLEEVPEPELRPGTVKIKVEWAGICGTDLHNYTHPMVPDDYIHPLFGEHGPHVQGHEFSGRITAVADDVPDLPVGALVAVEPLMSDGTCPACLRGDYNLCESFGFVGIMGGGGGMSEYVVVPGHRIHLIPEGISAETAALIEPLSVAWHAVRRSGLQPGDSAVVIGAGPIGLGLLMAAKAQGAGFVAVSEVSAARKRLASQFGADAVFDPTRDDVAARVHAAVPGGVRASFEASGAGTPAVQALLGVLAKGGTAITVASGHPAEFDPNALMTTEINYTGSFGYNASDFPGVIEAIRDGRIRPDALVTSRISLEDAQQQGYEALLNHGDAQVKVLVHP
ncbi:2,3-butanediol dehydrogenase [Nocardia sp. NBC_00565]|uniref:2,3-butanediol dehydrogenase n=1 Tax=Nocardia sp. NBC_00565 TaxID=2975993 RepID=UPI002E8030BC|nr:2,3-butanediol dehydrogenase [Nocardia sp. NBC_00565]WUC06658.1 2,3-butanediol dehydrogenase [Nocardia sp. NBC_00565]